MLSGKWKVWIILWLLPAWYVPSLHGKSSNACRLVFLIDAVGGHNNRIIGLLRHWMVAPNDSQTHLSSRSITRREPLDMSWWWCVLQCIRHLGCGRPTPHVWAPWSVHTDELVLPRWLAIALSCMGFVTHVSKGKVDHIDQHAHLVRSHRSYASGRGSELPVLGGSRDLLQLCGV